MELSVWTEFKNFVSMMWCFKTHLTKNQKKLISLNRYVKCSVCEGEYLEIKYNFEDKNKING